MGSRMLRTFMLLLLSVLIHGSVSEVEVELAPDGSVIMKNEPMASATRDSQLSVAIEKDENVASIAKDTENAEKESNMAILTTLQKELVIVEEMVRLQEKKLAVLQGMRGIWMQEQMNMQENEEVTKRRNPVDVGEIIERRLDAAIAETVAESRDFDSFFVETASVELEKEVADMKMMKIRAGSAMELIAVAYKDGVIVFYTSTTEELLRINTERNGIKSIAMESLDDQPCLVVTYDSSSIKIYELNLVEKSKDESVDGQEQMKMFTISRGFAYQLSVNGYRTVELSVKPSVITIVRSSRQLVVAVAQVDGIIDFRAVNGTILRQIQTHASISAMEAKRNLLAFSNGTNIILSSMTRAQGTIFHTCPGSSAQVSSIAFDAMQPEIMYAGTHRGEVLVYTVNSGASSGAEACRLLSRSTVTKYPRDKAPIVLATTKMYVIASGFQDVAVFNVSKTHRNGIPISRMCTSHLNRHIPLTEQDHIQPGAYIPAMAFSEGTVAPHLALIAAGIGGQTNLLVFHSLLPDEKETFDFQWTVLIYGGIIIATVIGSQLFILWQRRTSVNPWDSVSNKHNSPYKKYSGFSNHEHTSEFGEDFGRYNSLSDELQRKFSQAKKESARRSMDEDADY